jgi:6-pyruvoyl-tetrahydropterin synthase
MLTIMASADFNADHVLPLLPNHEARHQHNYLVTLKYTGAIVDGMLPDYEVVQSQLEATVAPLRGANLNDIAGLENPTSEAMVFYLLSRLGLPGTVILVSLTVDKDGSHCTWDSPMYGVDLQSLRVKQSTAFANVKPAA